MQNNVGRFGEYEPAHELALPLIGFGTRFCREGTRPSPTAYSIIGGRFVNRPYDEGTTPSVIWRA